MRVFAPGKLVLTGAYAVLNGAPAIVAATSRGAIADSSRAASFVTPEVKAALGDRPAPHVDASSMFASDRKLGLGASAAILVASLAASEGADLTDPAARASLFERAYAAHSATQSGGSGVDVAASVYGGALEYTPGKPIPRALPMGLELAVFALGTSAKTSELRGVVDRLRETDPALFDRCMGDLTSIAFDAALAVRNGSRASFIDAVGRAARALARLGEASGAPIVPEGFAALEATAAAEGAAFCVSGAGGGDVAVFFGSARPSPAFAEHARALGLFAIDLAVDEKGVRALSQVTPESATAPSGTTREHAPTS